MCWHFSCINCFDTVEDSLLYLAFNAKQEVGKNKCLVDKNRDSLDFNVLF